MNYIEEIIERVAEGHEVLITFANEYYGEEKEYEILVGINHLGPFITDAVALRDTDEVPEGTEELIPLLHILLFFNKIEIARNAINESKDPKLQILNTVWANNMYPKLSFNNDQPITIGPKPVKHKPTLDQVKNLIKILKDGLSSQELLESSEVTYLLNRYPPYIPSETETTELNNQISSYQRALKPNSGKQQS